MVEPLQKTVRQFLRMLNIYLPYIPAIQLWVVALEKWKHKKSHTNVYIAALFIIAQNCKESKMSFKWGTDKTDGSTSTQWSMTQEQELMVTTNDIGKSQIYY